MIVLVVDHTTPIGVVRTRRGGVSKCVVCQVVHTHKTYHLNVDAKGRALVSEGVLAGLRRAGVIVNFDDEQPGNPKVFLYDGPVDHPPPIVVGMGGNVPTTPMQVHIDREELDGQRAV